MKRVIFFLLFCFPIGNLLAQDSYIHDYLKGDMSKVSSRIILENFQDGVVSVVAAFPENFHPQSLVINYYDLSGRLQWSKRHRFPFDVQPITAKVINNKLYLLGLKGRNGGSGQSTYSGFFAVITTGGEIEHFEETSFAGGIDLFGNLFYDETTQTFITCGLISESSDPGNTFQALFTFNLNGEFLSVKKLFESYSGAMCLKVPGQGIYVVDNSRRVLLDEQRNPIRSDRFQGSTHAIWPYKAFAIGEDSVLTFVSDYDRDQQKNFYSIGIWDTREDKITTRLRSDDFAFSECVKTENGFLIIGNRRENIFIYELNKNLEIIRSVGYQFAASSYIYNGAIQVCDNEILGFSANSDSSSFEVIKSTNGWSFLGGQGVTPLLHEVDSTIVIETDPMVNYQLANLSSSGNVPSVSSSNLSTVPIVIASYTNCNLINFPSNSMLVCNESAKLLEPDENFRQCLPVGANRGYLWSDGFTTPDRMVAIPGWYKLVVNEDVCRDSDSVYVQFDKAQIAISGDGVFCSERSEKARFMIETSSGAIEWGPIYSTDSVYETVNSETVFVKLTSLAGCIATDTILAEEICQPLLYFPTAFTPDGDGINETYRASIEFAVNPDFRIFNRWGELIYQTNEPVINWDGLYKGADSKPGIYIWQLKYTSSIDHKKAVEKGSFNLIR